MIRVWQYGRHNYLVASFPGQFVQDGIVFVYTGFWQDNVQFKLVPYGLDEVTYSHDVPLVCFMPYHIVEFVANFNLINAIL